MQQKNKNIIFYVTKRNGTEKFQIDQSEYDQLRDSEKLKYQNKDDFIQQWQEYFEAKYPSIIKLAQAVSNYEYLLKNYMETFKQHLQWYSNFKDYLENMKSDDPKISSYMFILSIANDSNLKQEKSAKQLLDSLQIAYQAYLTSQNVNIQLFDLKNFYNEDYKATQKIQELLRKIEFDNNTVGSVEKIIHQQLQSIPQNEKVYSADSTFQTNDEWIGYSMSTTGKIGLCFVKRNQNKAEFGCFENDYLRWGCSVTALSRKSYTVFVGSFAKGLIEGKGKMYGKDDLSIYSEYEGEFQSGKRHGYGKFEWYDQENYNNKDNQNSHFKSRYEGGWKEELFNGKGKLEFFNKGKLTILEGQFQHGELVKDEQATITIDENKQQLKQYIEFQKNKQNPIQQNVPKQPFQFHQVDQQKPQFPTFPNKGGTQFTFQQTQLPQQQIQFPQKDQEQKSQFPTSQRQGITLLPPQQIQPNLPNQQNFPNNNNLIQPQIAAPKQNFPIQAPIDNQFKLQQNVQFLNQPFIPQENGFRQSKNDQQTGQGQFKKQ